MSNRLKLLLQLFWTFLKIGPVSFGGGYAIIPVIEREVVEKKKWVKPENVTDVFAIAQSIPGAIAINSATFIGYRIAGKRGAVAALLGIFLPTFLIVIGLGILFLNIQDNPKIAAAFEAIRATIVALIAYAAYKIGKTSIFDKTTCTTFIGTIIVLFLFQVHPVIMILAGMVLGIVLTKIKDHFGFGTEEKKNSSSDELEWFMGEGI